MELCKPQFKFLEIGCGNLHLAKYIIDFLDTGNYYGIDPNYWLRQDALLDETLKSLIEIKQAKFSSVSDFNASEFGINFDFIFSHSVLSHCAHWQLNQYLRNTSKILNFNGRILSSIRLAEGNIYGNEGSFNKEDSVVTEWVYPEVSFFTYPTIKKIALEYGLNAIYMPNYTEFYIKTRPTECHDWIVFSKIL